MLYKVTIGIPVYNVKNHIRLTMDSVLAQTFSSIEFLVLDDCGTDGSMDIIRDYLQTHPRGKDIHIVRQPQNRGIGCARNRIVEEATGKYLYFVDADDYIAPNTIELLYTNAQKYNAQIVYGSHERVEEFEGQIKRRPFQYPFMQFLQEDEFATYVYRQYDGIQAMTWNFLIDLDIYKKNNLRYQPINYWEDFLFTLDLPTYITRAVLLPDITYYYCCRSGSLSNYEKRDHISKNEIVQTINAINVVKDNSDRLRNKSYFPRRMYKLMMTDFYVVCTILRNEKLISPSFNKWEIRDIMKSFLTLSEILHFRQARFANFVLYLFYILPPSFSVFLMKKIGRAKGLVKTL